MKAGRTWVPRLNVELPPEQVQWLQTLPYGTKKQLFTVLVGDLIKACETVKDGVKLKPAILAGIISRGISLSDISPIVKDT